jgi:hypothetical protein
MPDLTVVRIILPSRQLLGPSRRSPHLRQDFVCSHNSARTNKNKRDAAQLASAIDPVMDCATLNEDVSCAQKDLLPRLQLHDYLAREHHGVV